MDERGKIEVGTKIKIKSKPVYWTSGGNQRWSIGNREVTYPYIFTVKDIHTHDDPDYLGLFDGKYGWSYKPDIFEIVDEEPWYEKAKVGDYMVCTKKYRQGNAKTDYVYKILVGAFTNSLCYLPSWAVDKNGSNIKCWRLATKEEAALYDAAGEPVSIHQPSQPTVRFKPDTWYRVVGAVNELYVKGFTCHSRLDEFKERINPNDGGYSNSRIRLGTHNTYEYEEAPLSEVEDYLPKKVNKKSKKTRKEYDKWYRLKATPKYVAYCHKYGKYGWNGTGEWFSNDNKAILDDRWEEVSDEEVIHLLLTYAIENYPVGTGCISAYDKITPFDIESSRFTARTDRVARGSSIAGLSVYENGDWAEIVQKESPYKSVITDAERKTEKKKLSVPNTYGMKLKKIKVKRI